MFTDPIADLLTRLRNANQNQKTVIIPASRFKLEICKILKENNFLSQYYWDQEKRVIKVDIKYNNKDSLLNELKRISKPSCRIYLTAQELKKKCVGYRLYLVSTSQGLLSHREALKRNIGGELVCSIS